jgi:hypothetical protein
MEKIENGENPNKINSGSYFDTAISAVKLFRWIQNKEI